MSEDKMLQLMKGQSYLLVYYVQSPYITEPECTNTQYKKFSPTTATTLIK